MPINLEYNRPIWNGRDGPDIVRSSSGLGNTNPIATHAPTFPSGASMRTPFEARPAMGPDFVINDINTAALAGSLTTARIRTLFSDLEVTAVTDARARGATLAQFAGTSSLPASAPVLKPPGEVVLFRKIMDDWGFNDQEAATLLGFEAALDINEIYFFGQRDANDRLRTVLRIATDLDALFGEVVAIRGWFGEPQRDLDGATPYALLTEGSMEDLLRVKYYVAYLSGR
jgi:Protein of unknown function (DUF2384)